MTWRAKAFIGAVLAAGATVLTVELTRGPWVAHGRFAVYLLAAVLASGLKVELPDIHGTLSINLIVNLVAVAELSPCEALAVGCTSAVCQSLWRKHHIELVHVVYNVTQMALSIEASQVVFQYSAQILGPALPLRMLATASAYFLVNTLLVAGVIALTEHRQFRQTWAEFYLWSFSNYLVGGVLACFIAWSNLRLGWQTSAMMVPVGYLIYRSYRLYLAKLENEKEHVEQMAALHLRTIEALALAIDAKDHTTHDHLQRVRVFAVELGQGMELSTSEVEALRAAALLHDIGKLAVPEHIINKPGRLSPEEFEKMKIHPIVGAEILERVNFPYPVVPIVRSHHERYDGTGYPDGLKGEQIPIGARILSAVDSLDALSSDRQYRKAMSLEEAIRIIGRESGKSFDPQVVRILQARYHELEAKVRSEVLEPARASNPVKMERNEASSNAIPAAAIAPAPGNNFRMSISNTRRELQTLVEIANDLGSSLSLDETLALLAVRLGKAIPHDAVVIWVRQQGELVPRLVKGESYRLLSSLRIPLGQGLSGWVAENNRSIV